MLNQTCGYMPSSADIWVLSKIAELAERCGASPLDADIHFYAVESRDKIPSHYKLNAIDTITSVPEEEGRRIQKVWTLLGLDELGQRSFDNIDEVGAAIAQALSRAPRARDGR